MGNKTGNHPYPHPYAKILMAMNYSWIVSHDYHLNYFKSLLGCGSLLKFITDYNMAVISAKSMGLTPKLNSKLKSFVTALTVLETDGFIEKTGIVWNSLYDYKIIQDGIVIPGQPSPHTLFNPNSGLTVAPTIATPALVPTPSVTPVVQPQVVVNTKMVTITGVKDYSMDIFIAEKLVRLYNSAQKRNKEFNLTFAHLKRKLQKTTCAYTGVKFTYDNPDAPTYPTIDRIDNSKGYVIGNIVVCTNIANEWKNHVLEDSSSKLYMGYDHVNKMMSTLNKLRG